MQLPASLGVKVLWKLLFIDVFSGPRSSALQQNTSLSFQCLCCTTNWTSMFVILENYSASSWTFEWNSIWMYLTCPIYQKIFCLDWIKGTNCAFGANFSWFTWLNRIKSLQLIWNVWHSLTIGIIMDSFFMQNLGKPLPKRFLYNVCSSAYLFNPFKH